jgi:outer membrane receptor protein involved in Fe transport
MSRCIPLRYAVPALLAAALLPAAAFAQSQDSQSVAEAARRAREKKKTQTKSAKVITDETLDVKKGDVQSATAEQLRIPGTPDTSAQTASSAPNAPAAGAAGSVSSSATKATADGKEPKEVTDLKEKIKQAENDLDLLNREYRLDQEAYFSKPDYAGDTAGKQKLDDEKLQISGKQQEVDRLKAKLADLLQLLGMSAATPPKP